jgi:hypothetical protein
MRLNRFAAVLFFLTFVLFFGSVVFLEAGHPRTQAGIIGSMVLFVVAGIVAVADRVGAAKHGEESGQENK